jgi:hypothetical protein
MLKNALSHFKYANVAATLALVFSMSGGALAATHFLINSTTQINPKVLKQLKGKTGKKGAAGQTGATGPSGATGPVGPTGKEGPGGPEGKEGKVGPAGPEGKTGPSGAEGKEGPAGPEGPSKLSALKEVASEEVNVEEGETESAFAECPTGQLPVSGGFDLEGPAPVIEISTAFSEEEEGETHAGWVFIVENNGNKEGPNKIAAVAYCSGEGEAVTPAHLTSAHLSRAAREKLTARLLASRRFKHEARAR